MILAEHDVQFWGGFFPSFSYLSIEGGKNEIEMGICIDGGDLICGDMKWAEIDIETEMAECIFLL